MLSRPCSTHFFPLVMALLLSLHSVAAVAATNGGSSATAFDNNSQSPLDLALKTITLSQGEGGFELWRLKAEWADIQKQDGKIFLIQPRLMYFMREDDSVMYVQSESGEVDQKEQILRFIDNVLITQNDTMLTGKVLVYDGTAKTMTMPEEAYLNATGIQGSCNHLIWFMDTKRIESTGNVVAHLKSFAPEGSMPPDIATLILDSMPESGQ